MLMYWLLVYGPFILFLLYGLAKGRPGFVVGPVLLGLAAYALSNAALNKFDVEIAEIGFVWPFRAGESDPRPQSDPRHEKLAMRVLGHHADRGIVVGIDDVSLLGG